MILDPCTVQTKLSQLPLVQIVKFQCLSNRKFPEFFKTHPTQSTFWLREETKESACRLSTCVRESMRTFKASKPASHWASNWVRTTRAWQRTQIHTYCDVKVVSAEQVLSSLLLSLLFLLVLEHILLVQLDLVTGDNVHLGTGPEPITSQSSVFRSRELYGLIRGHYYLDSSPSFFNTWVANTGWVFLLVNGSLTWTLH